MSDSRPILRCQEKGCPCIGRFDSGRCPMHERDTPPRRPDVLEDWTETER